MNTLSNRRMMVVSSIIFIGFMSICLWFMLALLEQYEEKNVAYLADNTAQAQFGVSLAIAANYQLLHSVAAIVATEGVSVGWQDLALLEQVNRENDFIRMGLADSRGQAAAVDLSGAVYRHVDLSAEEFFRTALAGQEALSAPLYDPMADDFVLYYAVPLYAAGRVQGVLYAVSRISALQEWLSQPLYRGAGSYALIDHKGTIVIPGHNPEPGVVVGANVFQLGGFAADERAALAQALAAGQSGSYTFMLQDREQVAILMPLNLNRWFMLSVISRGELLANYQKTTAFVLVLIVVSGVLLLLLLRYQMRFTHRTRAELEKLAFVDPITGARNLAKFELDAAQILKDNCHKDGCQKKYAVWSFDTKNFSSINEIFGSDTGNRVLQRISAVFEVDAPPDAIHCRVSADIFAGLRSYKRREELADWFWQVIDRLAQREVISAKQMRIDDVMGLYCLEDFDEQPTVSDMISRASVARRAAKAHTGNAVLFYTHHMQERQLWHTELEAGGQEALANGDMTFFLQPKVLTHAVHRLSGAEVLARWQHPRHGWIAPQDFIPLFERNGFIVDLDRYIFEQACQWYRRYLDHGLPPLRLAINVSRQGLLREDMLSYYTAVKENYHIADDALELEFTESVLLDDYHLFSNVVSNLKQAGFICSIDDFGAGYSSLNVLRNLPIDVLKLDAQFFRQGENDARGRIVVANFIHMSQQLGIKTVAEGVEDAAQVDFLQECGCDMIQGYVFAQPLPPEDFTTLVNKNHGIFTLPLKTSIE